MRRILLVLTFALCGLLLGGCREMLYSGISESDANEMLSTLLKRDVDARKIDQGKGLFAIEVDERDLVRALDIVRENSLPRTDYQDLGRIFTGQAMISSQLEERTRLAYSLSQELAATFAKISGVIDSRVHVVLVQHDQASGLTTPPSAAVFLRHVPGSPVVSMIGEIKETAAKAVPGLTHDRVSVMLEVFREKIIPPTVREIPWYAELPAVIGLTAGALILLMVLVLAALVRSGMITLPKKAAANDGKSAK